MTVEAHIRAVREVRTVVEQDLRLPGDRVASRIAERVAPILHEQEQIDREIESLYIDLGGEGGE